MSFTQEAVRLECRTGSDWRPLGQVRFSGGDMASVLNALREEAGGQAGELDTVLVIPDDQILYTVLTVPYGSDTAGTIARALEASTPYSADDLVFDWCPAVNGDIETLRVAAVARRTLDEAEEFARAQGFRPSGYQARPGDDRFQGQPDFGPSRLAQDQFNRRPFSGPDLSQARVTAPVIDPVTAPAAAAVIVSRITPHVVTAPAAPVAAADAAPDAAQDKAAVIRHGGPVAAKRLSPRAEAIHNRAAAARAQRAEGGRPAAAAPTMAERLRRLDPARLPVMVGGLALILVLALLWLGRPTPQDQVATLPAPQAEPATAEPVTAEPEAAPAPTPPVETATAPDQPDALDLALAEALAQAQTPVQATEAPETQPATALLPATETPEAAETAPRR
ncbi:hypothetical protein [Paracoccus aestuarii]|uniref:hypothetical protein n=1 Tax=Paracoccus aestuarii TaxID=453842 RepID=UPI00235096F3|nr:hypothetical protein [Paracoccus aestuarii]WCQ98175.1 hypothetical protein JHW48_09425 [Paracoccus aestuarii]